MWLRSDLFSFLHFQALLTMTMSIYGTFFFLPLRSPFFLHSQCFQAQLAGLSYTLFLHYMLSMSMLLLFLLFFLTSLDFSWPLLICVSFFCSFPLLTVAISLCSHFSFCPFAVFSFASSPPYLASSFLFLPLPATYLFFPTCSGSHWPQITCISILLPFPTICLPFFLLICVYLVEMFLPQPCSPIGTSMVTFSRFEAKEARLCPFFT